MLKLQVKTRISTNITKWVRWYNLKWQELKCNHHIQWCHNKCLNSRPYSNRLSHLQFNISNSMIWISISNQRKGNSKWPMTTICKTWMLPHQLLLSQWVSILYPKKWTLPKEIYSSLNKIFKLCNKVPNRTKLVINQGKWLLFHQVDKQ